MLRIEELVAVPGRRERPGLGLTVADHACDDQIGIIERGPESVDQRVAELAALMDRPRRFGRRVAGNAAGERELLEQALHALSIGRDRRVDFAVGPLQPRIGHHAWTAVTGTADVEQIEIARADDPVEMDVDEVKPRGRTPMAEQARLDVAALERPGQ